MEPKLEPQLEPQLEPELEPELEPKLEPELEPKLELKLEPELEPKPEPVADQQSLAAPSPSQAAAAPTVMIGADTLLAVLQGVLRGAPVTAAPPAASRTAPPLRSSAAIAKEKHERTVEVKGFVRKDHPGASGDDYVRQVTTAR